MKINYPNPTINKERIVKENNIKTQGMLFESELNTSNQYYLTKDYAVIYKKPTPVQIVKVSYPKRSAAKITEAYYKTPSTTDYNGIYKGRYIDYEAKETVRNYFPFAHIFPHQIDHLIKIKKHGGLAFIIIYFRLQHEVIVIDIDTFYQLYKFGEKKSITVEDAEKIGKICKLGYAPPIDYLKAIDDLYDLD